jgi:hypothetical protein
MLPTDAFSAILFIVVALFVLHKIKPTQARYHWEDVTVASATTAVNAAGAIS